MRVPKVRLPPVGPVEQTFRGYQGPLMRGLVGAPRVLGAPRVIGETRPRVKVVATPRIGNARMLAPLFKKYV